MKKAIIVGRAVNFLREYREARDMMGGRPDWVIVVGKVGEVFPDPIDIWVSFHCDLFQTWAERRALAGLPPAGRFWGATFKSKRVGAPGPAVAHIDWVSSRGGSSGFLAVEGARALLGCECIVLAGIPMTAEGHHAPESITPKEAQDGRWVEADQYWPTWLDAADKLRPHVRSMSGRTRDLFGAPDAEWLAR